MRTSVGFASLLRAQLLAALFLVAAAGPRCIAPMINGGSAKAAASRPRTFSTVTTAAAAGISYHGGPIMTRPINIYFIWYGGGASGFTEAQKNIFRDITASFSSGGDAANTVQKWWAINQPYYDSSGNHVSTAVSVAGEYDDSAASQDPVLSITSSTNKVFDAISHAITSGGFPVDPNGVYVVIGHQGVSQTGVPDCSGSGCSVSYCSQFCGWHYFKTYSGQPLKYAYVGVGCSACAPPGNGLSSPNGDPAIDAAVNIFAHELAETATDPLLNAWWADSDGDENADKCSFNFGTTLAATNGGGLYNLVGQNGKQYLLQQNWDFTTGSCQTVAVDSGSGPKINSGAATGDPHFEASYYDVSSGSTEPQRLDFDFQGLPDQTFCITSDVHIALNARFVGGEPDAEGVSGTWMDAISVFWASEKGKRHTLVVAIDQSKDFLVEDCYQILVDGNVVEVKPGNEEEVRWASPDGSLLMVRPSGHIGLPTWGAISISVPGSLHLELSSEGEERISRMPTGKFLNMQVKAISTTQHVHGVLGQMFAPGAVERRLSMVVSDEYHREYVDCIVEDYITPSLTDPGCYYSEFADASGEPEGDIKRRLLAMETEPVYTASLNCTHELKGGVRFWDLMQR